MGTSGPPEADERSVGTLSEAGGQLPWGTQCSPSASSLLYKTNAKAEPKAFLKFHMLQILTISHL